MKPSSNSYLFWNTDINNIDWQINANAVIVRVLKRGDLEDFREIKIFYGDQKIIEAATKARSLYKTSVHFLSVYFDIPLENFRCYKNNCFPNFPLVYSSID